MNKDSVILDIKTYDSYKYRDLIIKHKKELKDFSEKSQSEILKLHEEIADLKSNIKEALKERASSELAPNIFGRVKFEDVLEIFDKIDIDCK